jgi:hypothetical protein
MLEQAHTTHDEAVDMELGASEPVAKPVKAKPIDAIKSELKKNPAVKIVNGSAVYLSQLSGSPIAKRTGLVVFDKKTKEPKHVLGAFAGTKELIQWLINQKNSGLITEKRFQAAIDATTLYSNLDSKKQSDFEAKANVHASFATPKKSKSDPSQEKKEKKKPKSSKKTGPTAAELSAPANIVKTASGKSFVVFNCDALPDSMEQVKDKPVFGSFNDLLLNGSAPDTVIKMELVLAQEQGVALLKRLEAPSAAQLKSIAKAINVPVETLKVDKDRARDAKYQVAVRHNVLRAALKSHSATSEKSKKKQSAAMEAVKKEVKQKKVKQAREKEVKPLAV